MLIFVGSRRDGNSLKLANMVKKELEKERVSAEIIVPGNQLIKVCTGCMDCDKTQRCDFRDDMDDNIRKIKNEDILLFITPVRWNLLSGDLKIFIDRLNPLYSIQGLKDKKAIIVAIGSKAKDVYSTTDAVSSLRNFVDAAGMKCTLTYEFNDCLKSGDIELQEDEVNIFLEKVKTTLK